MPRTTTSAPTIVGRQGDGASWPEGSFRELGRELRTVVSTIAPGPSPLAVQETLHREVTRLVFGETASVSEDPDERHVQLLFMRGHMMRLLAAVVPLDPTEPPLEDDRLVVRVGQSVRAEDARRVRRRGGVQRLHLRARGDGDV